MFNEYELKKGPGTINAKGVLDLLNNASSDRWSVMLREAVQNSWDARSHESIKFNIRGYYFNSVNYNGLKKIFSVLNFRTGEQPDLPARQIIINI